MASRLLKDLFYYASSHFFVLLLKIHISQLLFFNMYILYLPVLCYNEQ
jgi:hypothetical protein